MDVVKYISDIFLHDCGIDIPNADITSTLKLLDQDLTIPYIARYRRKETGSLDAEQLRFLQTNYESFRKLQAKITTVIKKVKDEVSNEYLESIKFAKNVEEVDEMYAPFKKGGKTLAEKARKLGLQNAATDILHTGVKVDIYQFINTSVEGLESLEMIETGIQNIIADEVAKDNEIYEKMRIDIEPRSVIMKTKKTKKCGELDSRKKYELYYEFVKCTGNIRNHQVLAVNRAEKEKIITVILEILPVVRIRLIDWIKKKWIQNNQNRYNTILIEKSVEDSFKRLVEKKFFRRIRTKLTKNAEMDAVNIFSSNLKHLLLVGPVKHKTILSIDPGFSNGCKIAVIDKHGNLKDTAIIHPFKKKLKCQSEKTVVDLADKYDVGLIAIGNGTACRETEQFISDLIKCKKLSAPFSIVDEAGASVYSVTPEAKKEFGDLDPNLISSVSIGRRLQDPLIELTKIDPKHLGIGMYQHDMDAKLLNAALLHTIDDCVNFVGVDLNICSSHLLKHVSGLNQKQADAIVAYRDTHGSFTNREELLEVKGIGKVTYQNCAGFVRITPDIVDTEDDTVYDAAKISGVSRKRKLNSDAITGNPTKRKKLKSKHFQVELLDQTWIHPESYDVAMKVLGYLKVKKERIGTSQIKTVIDDQIASQQMEKLSLNLSTDIHTLNLILEGLKQPSDHDARNDFEKPMFKSEFTCMEQLKVGIVVTGSVRNVTSFGAFVDIGIQNNGLIHNNNNNLNVHLGPGDKVQCAITNIDVTRQRVGLSLKKKVTKDIKLF